MDQSEVNLNDPVGYIAKREYNEKLADKITLLAAQINAANYQFLKLIAEFDQRSGWAEVGVKSCVHWLNWKCDIVLSAAREKVRTMTRVASNENEDYLMHIANHGTAG